MFPKLYRSLTRSKSTRRMLGVASVMAFGAAVVVGDAMLPRKGAGQYLGLPFSGAEDTAPRIADDSSARIFGDLARCRAEIERLERLPALPGTPKLDAHRASTLAQYKAEPVLFVRAPAYEPTTDPVVKALRRRVAGSSFPADAVARATETFTYRPELGRQVLLREGYLYADSPGLMRGILGHVRAEHMFASEQIWIQRGARTEHAVRDPSTGRYTYDTGPNQGHRVRVLPFDRIASSEGQLAAPVHRDLRLLRNRLGFDRMRVERITPEGIVASLQYDRLWIPTVLDGDGPELEKVCEAVEPGQRPALQQARQLASRRLPLVHALRNVVLAQVREGLPFDEPKTEYGQQDGKLRPAWEQAYALKFSAYRFQGDTYPVFTSEGSPMVPQVCLDFLLDTLDRAGGGWWTPLGQPRERTRGRFERDGFALANPRSIDQFVTLSGTLPSQMELRTIPPAERIEFQRERAFLKYLEGNADAFKPGDMVILRGYLPRPSDRRHDIMHYHSAYVYETDPITGVPMVLAGNAGVPRLTTWRFEMLRSPRRAVHHVIRLQTEWLESFVQTPEGDPQVPPPLVAVSPYGVE